MSITTDADLYRGKKAAKFEFHWSDLPIDLLLITYKKLYDICDFVRFRAVCKSWRTVTSFADLPPQIPWVMEDTWNIFKKEEYLRFRSLLSDEIYTIHCSKPYQKDLLASHGYLYTRDFHYLKLMKHYLMNPLTKHEVTFQFKSRFFQILICMSPNFFQDGDYMVLENQYSKKIEFYQPHKSKRDCIEGPQSRRQLDTRRGNACCKGMYFLHDIETCNTEVFDIVHRTSSVIPPPENPGDHNNVCFVESEGNILRIVVKRNKDREIDVSDQFAFDIYRLDVEDKNQYRWIKIDEIDNQILFLDCLHSSGISVTSCESTKVMKNCIYYMNFDGIYRYDIKSRRTQIVPCRLHFFGTWFVPSLVSLPSAAS